MNEHIENMKMALRGSSPKNFELIEHSVCDCCEKLSPYLATITFNKDEQDNDVDLCTRCVKPLVPSLSSKINMKITRIAGSKRDEKVLVFNKDEFIEELGCRFPELTRVLPFYLDGDLRDEDGKENEILKDIYSKTVQKTKLPSEKQVKFFVRVARDIISKKSQGISIKQVKKTGLEVSNLLADLAVSKILPKHKKPFEDMKKFFNEKQYLTEKQFNYLLLIRNEKAGL